MTTDDTRTAQQYITYIIDIVIIIVHARFIPTAVATTVPTTPSSSSRLYVRKVTITISASTIARDSATAAHCRRGAGWCADAVMVQIVIQSFVFRIQIQ